MSQQYKTQGKTGIRFMYQPDVFWCVLQLYTVTLLQDTSWSVFQIFQNRWIQTRKLFKVKVVEMHCKGPEHSKCIKNTQWLEDNFPLHMTNLWQPLLTLMLEAKFQETGQKLARPATNYLYLPVCSDLSTNNPHKLGKLLNGILAHYHLQIASMKPQQRILDGKYLQVISLQVTFWANSN